MGKFCGKCGSPLDKKTGLCPNCNRAEIAKSYLDELRKRRIRIILSVCAAVIVVGLVLWGVIGWGGSKTVTAKDAQSAIEQLAKLGNDFGYENALDELTEVNTSTLDGDNFFRLQQNYRGIPVYGRNVVCVTDEDGKQLAISGNPLDVDERVLLTPQITQEQAEQSVVCYFQSSNDGVDIDTIMLTPFSNQNLCIYVEPTNNKSHLAYEIDLTATGRNGGVFTAVIDAHTGEVLCCGNTIFQEMQTGFIASDVNKTNGFPVEFDGNNFSLNDGVHNVFVYSLGGTSSDWFGNGNYLVNRKLITSSYNIWGNEAAEMESNFESGALLYTAFMKISKLYSEQLSFFFDRAYDEVNLYYDDMADGGGNSLGGCDGKTAIISMGAETGVEELDALGHEFMHCVSLNVAHWKLEGETSALNEAYSDIFGELIESMLIGQEPNWRNRFRNMQDPSAMGLPLRLSDSNNANTDFSHGYSTVISHAAYLMWNGIDGRESKRISTEELAELWYRALLMMPSDCTFMECRNLVNLAASSMRLPLEKRSCILEAFALAGLDGDSEVDYTVHSDATLTVLKNDGSSCDDYHVIVYIPQTGLDGNEIIKPVERSIDVRTSEPCAVGFKSNQQYKVIISSGEHTQMTEVSFTVIADDESKNDNICIYTNAVETALTEPTTATQVLGEHDNFDFLPRRFNAYGMHNWNSGLNLNPDGTFTCEIKTVFPGGDGTTNVDGTGSISKCSGKFTNLIQVDDLTYKMTLEYVEQLDQVGREYVEDRIKFVVDDWNLFDGVTEVYIYLPGTKYDIDPIGTMSTGGKELCMLPPFDLDWEWLLENGYVLYIDEMTAMISDSDENRNDILKQTLDFSKAWSITYEIEDGSILRESTEFPHAGNTYFGCFRFYEDGKLEFLYYKPYTDLMFGYTGKYSADGENVELSYESDGRIYSGCYRFDPSNLTLTQVSDKGIHRLDSMGTVHQIIEDPFYKIEDVHKWVEYYLLHKEELE